MNKLKNLDWLAFILVVIGGLNWGLIGAFNFNLVDTIFGEGGIISRIIYILVGVSAIYLIAMMGKLRKE